MTEKKSKRIENVMLLKSKDKKTGMVAQIQNSSIWGVLQINIFHNVKKSIS